jgi:hypothetical protein
LSSQSEALLRVHHHVQDGGSADGTVEWLRKIVDATRSSRGYGSDEARGMLAEASAFLYQLTFASKQDLLNEFSALFADGTFSLTHFAGRVWSEY